MSLETIKKIDEGVWCLESYFLSLGCRGSLRMTILKTQSGLLLYSPVALNAEHVASIRALGKVCLLYTSPSPRDLSTSRMPSSA